MNNKMIKTYLARAKEIIGERTPGEIAHDDVVVAALESGLPIDVALAKAAATHPAEALAWDASTIDDIAAHYDDLKEHAQILRKLGNKQPR